MTNHHGEEALFNAASPIFNDRIPQTLIDQSNELVLAARPIFGSLPKNTADQTFSLTLKTLRIERQLKRAQTVSEALKKQLSTQLNAEFKALEVQLNQVNHELNRYAPRHDESGRGTKDQLRQQLDGLAKTHNALLTQGDQIKDQLRARKIKQAKLAQVAANLTGRLKDLDYSFSGVIETIKKMQNPDEADGALASISAESGSFRSLISDTRRRLNEVQAASKQLDLEIDELNKQIGSQNSHMASLGLQLGQIAKVVSFSSGSFKHGRNRDPSQQNVEVVQRMQRQRDWLVKRLKSIAASQALSRTGHAMMPQFIADSGHHYYIYSNTLQPENKNIDFELKRLMTVFDGVEPQTTLLTTQFSDDGPAAFQQYVARNVISDQVTYTNLYDDLFRYDKRFAGLQVGSLLHRMHEQGWRREDVDPDGGQIWVREALRRKLFLRADQTVRQIFSYDRNQVLIQVDVFSPEEQLMATQYIKNGNQVSTEDFFRKSDHSVVISKEYRDNRLLNIQVRDRSGILVSVLKDQIDLERWWFNQKLTSSRDVLVLDGQSELCHRLMTDSDRKFSLLPIFSTFDAKQPVETDILAGKGDFAGVLAVDQQVLAALATAPHGVFDIAVIGD